jgi:hypothetical protein
MAPAIHSSLLRSTSTRTKAIDLIFFLRNRASKKVLEDPFVFPLGRLCAFLLFFLPFFLLSHPAFFLLLFRHMHAFKGAQPQCTSHPPMTLELLARIFFFPLVRLFSPLPLSSHPFRSLRHYCYPMSL